MSNIYQSSEKKNKILVISGPTATGKTSLAVKVAKKFNGEIISADSRQVYKGLDIGVGKDHPVGTPIHLIDLIDPDMIFSVAEFQRIAFDKISNLQKQNKLPVVVGGSGLYIDSLLNPGYNTFTVPPSKILRFFLNKFPTKLLQQVLRLFNRSTLHNLNNSDVNNPRRLIRKIELELFTNKFKPTSTLKYDIYHISLTAPNEVIFRRIDDRVKSRLMLGHLKELKGLLKQYSWNDAGLKVSAYRVFKGYFDKKLSHDDVVKLWAFAEHADARHQKTWFKRYRFADFIDVSHRGWQATAIKKIDKWYNNL